jgi:hypothetical protein
MPIKVGGIPTARATMIPILVPRSSELQPLEVAWELELELEESAVSVPLAEESSPPPLVRVDDLVVGDAAVATSPTVVVVVEIGCPGVSWLQLGSIAAISPSIRP